MRDGPTLYHFPPSPYSMRVRLALEEKGVAWKSRIVDIVARRENYEPWFVRLHPGCVVPLLVDGDADRYAAKIADMESKKRTASAPEPRTEILGFVDRELSDLDEALRSTEFLAGPTYSLAEVYWTPILGRLAMLHLDERFARFSNVTRWWSLLRARPSFTRADVWTRFKPWVLAPFVLRLAAPYIAGALVVVAAAALLAWLAER